MLWQWLWLVVGLVSLFLNAQALPLPQPCLFSVPPCPTHRSGRVPFQNTLKLAVSPCSKM